MEKSAGPWLDFAKSPGTNIDNLIAGGKKNITNAGNAIAGAGQALHNTVSNAGEKTQNAVEGIKAPIKGLVTSPGAALNAAGQAYGQGGSVGQVVDAGIAGGQDHINRHNEVGREALGNSVLADGANALQSGANTLHNTASKAGEKATYAGEALAGPVNATLGAIPGAIQGGRQAAADGGTIGNIVDGSIQGGKNQVDYHMSRADAGMKGLQGGNQKQSPAGAGAGAGAGAASGASGAASGSGGSASGSGGSGGGGASWWGKAQQTANSMGATQNAAKGVASGAANAPTQGASPGAGQSAASGAGQTTGKAVANAAGNAAGNATGKSNNNANLAATATQGAQAADPNFAPAFKPQAMPQRGQASKPATTANTTAAPAGGPSDAFLKKTMGSYDPNSALDQKKAERIKTLWNQNGGNLTPNQVYGDSQYGQIKSAFWLLGAIDSEDGMQKEAAVRAIGKGLGWLGGKFTRGAGRMRQGRWHNAFEDATGMGRAAAKKNLSKADYAVAREAAEEAAGKFGDSRLARAGSKLGQWGDDMLAMDPNKAKWINRAALGGGALGIGAGGYNIGHGRGHDQGMELGVGHGYDIGSQLGIQMAAQSRPQDPGFFGRLADVFTGQEQGPDPYMLQNAMLNNREQIVNAILAQGRS